MADRKTIRELEKLQDALGSIMDENPEIKQIAELYDFFSDAIQAIKIAVTNQLD